MGESQLYLDSLNKASPEILMEVPLPSFMFSYLFFSKQNTGDFLQLCDHFPRFFIQL